MVQKRGPEFSHAPNIELAESKERSVSDRIDAIRAKLQPHLDHLVEVESGRGFSADTLSADVHRVDQFIEVERARKETNKLLEQLNDLRPDSESPLELFFSGEGMADIAQIVEERKQYLSSLYPEKESFSSSMISNPKLREAIRGYFKTSRRRVTDRAVDRVEGMDRRIERWKSVQQLHERLGVDAKTQQEQPEAESPRLEQARQRSYKNIRSSLSGYYERYTRFVQEGENAEEAVEQLVSRAEELEGNLVFAYYETIDDAEPILRSGAIKNLFELDDHEQQQRKKSAKPLEQIRRERHEIESNLGWEPETPVYHFVIEHKDDEKKRLGPSSNYGAVRFTFDFDALAEHATFTEGDSLNPTGLPPEIMNRGKERDVTKRQIAAEHLHIAKALFDVTRDHVQDWSKPLSYIEAQVGGQSGAEIFDALNEVTLDKSEMEKELRTKRYDQQIQLKSIDWDLEIFAENKEVPYREL